VNTLSGSASAVRATSSALSLPAIDLPAAAIDQPLHANDPPARAIDFPASLNPALGFSRTSGTKVPDACTNSADGSHPVLRRRLTRIPFHAKGIEAISGKSGTKSRVDCTNE